MATRLPASQRTREELTSLIEGRLSTGSAKNELEPLSVGARSKSLNLNVGSWLQFKKSSIRNTRPRLASKQSRQRMMFQSNYPALLGLDRSQARGRS
jgi:hypothetical protein